MHNFWLQRLQWSWMEVLPTPTSYWYSSLLLPLVISSLQEGQETSQESVFSFPDYQNHFLLNRECCNSSLLRLLQPTLMPWWHSWIHPSSMLVARYMCHHSMWPRPLTGRPRFYVLGFSFFHPQDAKCGRLMFSCQAPQPRSFLLMSRSLDPFYMLLRSFSTEQWQQ